MLPVATSSRKHTRIKLRKCSNFKEHMLNLRKCSSFKEHMLNLREMFQRFLEARLNLFQKEVWCLGHTVSPEVK
jgi:hypothetical protein